jgi:hypothetical protein
MNELIANKAQAHTIKVAPFVFNSERLLVVNGRDTETYVGSVDYLPRAFCIIDCALSTKGWVFCIERMVTNDFRPVFGAFHNCGHYSFAEIEEPKEGETMQSILILLVISNFWEILHPGDLPQKVSWRLE